MRTDEVGALVGEATRAGGAGQFGQQPLGLPGQFGRLGRGLVGHGSAQRGITGEGVDVAFLDAVEPQTEG